MRFFSNIVFVGVCLFLVGCGANVKTMPMSTSDYADFSSDYAQIEMTKEEAVEALSEAFLFQYENVGLYEDKAEQYRQQLNVDEDALKYLDGMWADDFPLGFIVGREVLKEKELLLVYRKFFERTVTYADIRSVIINTAKVRKKGHYISSVAVRLHSGVFPSEMNFPNGKQAQVKGTPSIAFQFSGIPDRVVAEKLIKAIEVLSPQIKASTSN